MKGEEEKKPEAISIEKLNLHGLTTTGYLSVEGSLTVEQKSALATRLAAALNEHGDPDDFANAEAILRLLVWNAEPTVLESMAQAAAANPNTPHSLAWALANDDEAAATPILAASRALSDADLVAIIEATASASKMGAIARRPTVSRDVSRSLARHGDEATLHVLLGNAKAEISDDAFASILERHGQAERIKNGLKARPDTSPAIKAQIATLVGPKPDPTTSPYPVGYTDDLSEGDMDALVSEMLGDQSITASFLVRKLCNGNFELFCRALAAVAQTPAVDVRRELLESASAYLPDAWAKATLAADWLPIASAAAAAAVHIDKHYSKTDPQLFRRNLVERTMANLRTAKHVLTTGQRNFFASL